MKTILIVEDDDDTAFLYQMVTLMKLDTPVELISDGLEALERVRSGKNAPALIVLDLHLPRVPGTEILDEARQRGIKVIVTSADANLAHSLSEQADVTLIKPLENPGLLTDFIAKFL